MNDSVKKQFEERISELGEECRPMRLAFYSVEFTVKIKDGSTVKLPPLPSANCCSAAAHKEALLQMVPVVERLQEVEVVDILIKQQHVHSEGGDKVLDGEKVCDNEVLAPAEAVLLGVDMEGNPIECDECECEHEDEDEDQDDDDEDDDEGESWKQ